ncbi:MAG TPA: signal peptidase I [Gaiellaceae bacterium]|nr:signal peptidase I [Gaiellaceae bacterium]
MKRFARVGSLLAVAALAAAAWLLLAPQQIGGSTSYAVVYGTSMEPHLHRGDLVILRGRAHYSVGQVVGYRSHDLHRNVLHRIVAQHGNRYVFKGDNNNFTDPEQPVASQLFGREWVVVPRAGAALERLRSPRYAAVAAALLVLVLVGAGPGSGVRRRRRGLPQAAPARAAGPAPPPRPRGSARRSAAIAAGVAGVCVLSAGGALTVASFREPVERTVEEPGLYTQTARFTWSAPAPAGAAYQGKNLGPSDPVFLRLVHRLDVGFAYRIGSRYPATFHGVASLGAVVSDGNGWRHRFPLAAAEQLRSGRAALEGTLDLRRVGATIARFERETGVHNVAYHLALLPEVRVAGTAGGRPVRTQFAPPLRFDLDDLRLQLARTPAPGQSNALRRTASASATRTERALLHGFAVPSVRRAALAADVVAAVLLTLAGVLLLGRSGRELDAILRRYGDLVVDVGAREPLPSDRPVTSIDALARIAERYDRLILHEVHGGRHSFVVEDAGVVFRYDAGAADDTLEFSVERLRPHVRPAGR